MRVGSLFSGIGGFDLGLERAGFEVAFQCDNDVFCNKVLAHHWPGVKRYSDVRDIGRSRGSTRGNPDGYGGVASGRGGQAGTGLLGGVDHARDIGRLNAADAQVGERPEPNPATAQQVGRRSTSGGVDLICGGFPCQDLSVAGKRAGLDGGRSGLWFEFKRILSELRPSWAIIENVPGLLSSNQGRDFAVVLDGLGECGFAGISWAVLDSQHFGVAQRRRRVYVVAGPSRRSVEQVLSLCEGCGGYHPARRTPGEDVAGPVAGGAYGTGRRTEDDPNLVLAHAKRAQSQLAHREDVDTYIPALSPAFATRDYKGTPQDVAEPAYVAHSLRADGFDASEDGTGRGTPIVSVRMAQTSSNGWGVDDSGTAYTLDGSNGQAVAGTLQGNSGRNQVDQPYAVTSSVRRLTPTECERLQGFPDSWTDVGGAADGPRYKALGNAVSVPVVEYLGLRIMAVVR